MKNFVLNAIQRRQFLFVSILISIAACIYFVWDSYASGQARASRHMDLHGAGLYANILIAIVIAIAIVIVWVIKAIRRDNPGRMAVWFIIPAIFIPFGFINGHIGHLFYCCPPGLDFTINRVTIGTWIFAGVSTLVIALTAMGVFFISAMWNEALSVGD